MNIKNFKHKVINKNKPPCSRAEVQREKKSLKVKTKNSKKTIFREKHK